MPSPLKMSSTHWLDGVRSHVSSHCNARPNPQDISLVVIHSVSLPEGEYGGGAPERLFTGTLDCSGHASFADLEGLQVSPHALIERDGSIVQFVPFDQRAWHAGESCWAHRPGCNDYSIGIELEGDVASPYTAQQYASLHNVLVTLCQHYPGIAVDRIVGHQEIAPGRKLDPGPFFDWQGLLTRLSNSLQQVHDKSPVD